MVKSISISENKHKRKKARYSRAEALRGKHAVYIVGRDTEGNARFKVGMTSNLSARLHGYESACGEKVMCLFQIFVKDRKEAAALERAFIDLLDEKMVVYGREWFTANKWELARLVKESVESSGIVPISIGGYDGFGERFGNFLAKQVYLDAVECMKTCAVHYPRR